MTYPLVWDKAELTDDEGRLDCRLPAREIAIPVEVRLIQSRSGPLLVWRDAPQAPGVQASRSPRPTLLTDFIALTSTDTEFAERVAVFAKSAGALMACNLHPTMPAYHGLSLDCAPGRFDDETLHSQWQPREKDLSWLTADWFWAPIETWRRWAQNARAIIDLAAMTHLGSGVERAWLQEHGLIHQLGDREWNHLGRRHWRYRQDPGSNWQEKLRSERHSTIALQREIAAWHVQRWQRMGAVQPIFDWSSANARVTFGGYGLFGALAAQLMFRASRSVGFDVCSSCGQLYRVNRRKAADRRHYCETCGHGAALRDAQRDQRLKRKALALRDDGASIETIQARIPVDRDRITLWLRPERAHGRRAPRRKR